jgi:hypothetical protein
VTIEEANYSLKLECALRQLNFVEIGWQAVALAGVFYVIPVSHIVVCHKNDDLLGFQLSRSSDFDPTHLGLRLDRRIIQTAKTALNLAISFS